MDAISSNGLRFVKAADYTAVLRAKGVQEQILPKRKAVLLYLGTGMPGITREL